MYPLNNQQYVDYLVENNQAILNKIRNNEELTLEDLETVKVFENTLTQPNLNQEARYNKPGGSSHLDPVGFIGVILIGALYVSTIAPGLVSLEISLKLSTYKRHKNGDLVIDEDNNRYVLEKTTTFGKIFNYFTNVITLPCRFFIPKVGGKNTDKHKYNGKMYKVHIGPKGGKFINVTINGKKEKKYI